MVCALADVVKVRAKRNSFHEAIKTWMAQVKIPGAATGRNTRKSICRRFSPSINAASSKLMGMDRKKLVRIQMVSGSVKIMLEIIIGYNVFRIVSDRKMMYRVLTIAIWGNIDAASVTPMMTPLPLKRNLAREYAQKDAGITASNDRIRTVQPGDSECARIAAEMVGMDISCSGIVASDDVIAWEMWYELTKLGKEIPEDYSLASCEHIHSRFPLPEALNSMNCFRGKMSVAAIDILSGKMRGGKREMSQVTVDPQMLQGKTVARLHEGPVPFFQSNEENAL